MDFRTLVKRPLHPYSLLKNLPLVAREGTAPLKGRAPKQPLQPLKNIPLVAREGKSFLFCGLFLLKDHRSPQRPFPKISKYQNIKIL